MLKLFQRLFAKYYSDLRQEIALPEPDAFIKLDFRFKLGIYIDFFQSVLELQVIINQHGYKVYKEGNHDEIRVNSYILNPIGYEESRDLTVFIFHVDEEIKPIAERGRECINLLIKMLNEPF